MKIIYALVILSVLYCIGIGLKSSRVIAVNVDSEIKVAKQSDIWNGYALLKRACSCESWGDPNKEPREFDEKGKVITGFPNPNDIGACQINTIIWGKKAKELGYDIYTLQGNINMSKYIYGAQGIGAWDWSKECWK